MPGRDNMVHPLTIITLASCSIAGETSVAVAEKSAIGVDALCVGVAIVGASHALIQV